MGAVVSRLARRQKQSGLLPNAKDYIYTASSLGDCPTFVA